MEEENIAGRDQVASELIDVDMEESLSPQPPMYFNFRLGRDAQQTTKCIKFALSALNLSFCFLGLWGHQAWNYIPRFLICALAIYKVFFLSYIDVFQKCGSFNYSSEAMKLALRHGNVIGNIDLTIFAMGSIFSYLVFIGCFMAAKRKVSALVTPSQLISKDIEKRGTFVEDALRIIRELQDGTLDDVIRIHEDLCTVVFSTVSAYSVWFVIHWFTYAAGVLLFIVWLSTEVEQLLRDGIGIPTVVLVYDGFILVCLVYLFLLPCVCAARITSGCAGIYEKINSTTSSDWNEGHPFRNRRNIALFITYAKDRRCGFRVGRITFNTSLAWISFFFGLTALLYHLF
ncbi:hypothetical protein ABFA07_018639 [Porites harrisoni]